MTIVYELGMVSDLAMAMVAVHMNDMIMDGQRVMVICRTICSSECWLCLAINKCGIAL